MREAADKSGLLVCSEVMDASQIQMMLSYVDILQVGARNMQNYFLLRALGTVAKPILLKRGMSATIEELLLSAEYIMAGGNHNVILCERGIRTFETATRNTLDIAAIRRHQETFASPRSSPTRHMALEFAIKFLRWLALRVVAGADGLLRSKCITNPEHALSDGAQSLYFEQFEKLSCPESSASLLLRSAGPSCKPCLPPSGEFRFLAPD